MKNQLTRFRDDESAVTSTEYALLGALIAVVIVAGSGTVGTEVVRLFTFVKDQVVLAM